MVCCSVCCNTPHNTLQHTTSRSRGAHGVLQCVLVCCSVCCSVCCNTLQESSGYRIRLLKTSGYGVATISRMLKNTGLFCKRDLQKRPIFCKETYIFKHPTHRSHPISTLDHSNWWKSESALVQMVQIKHKMVYGVKTPHPRTASWQNENMSKIQNRCAAKIPWLYREALRRMIRICWEYRIGVPAKIRWGYGVALRRMMRICWKYRIGVPQKYLEYMKWLSGAWWEGVEDIGSVCLRKYGEYMEWLSNARWDFAQRSRVV